MSRDQDFIRNTSIYYNPNGTLDTTKGTGGFTTSSGTDETRQSLYSGKLTFRLGEAHTISASVFGDPGTFNGRQVGTTRPRLGRRLERRIDGGTTSPLKYDGIFGTSFLLSAQYSHHEEKNDNNSPYENTQGIIRFRGGLSQLAPGSGPIYFVDERYKRDDFKLAGSFFAGAHEIKVGGEYEKLGLDVLREVPRRRPVSVRRYSAQRRLLVPVQPLLREGAPELPGEVRRERRSPSRATSARPPGPRTRSPARPGSPRRRSTTRRRRTTWPSSRRTRGRSSRTSRSTSASVTRSRSSRMPPATRPSRSTASGRPRLGVDLGSDEQRPLEGLRLLRPLLLDDPAGHPDPRARQRVHGVRVPVLAAPRAPRSTSATTDPSCTCRAASSHRRPEGHVPGRDRSAASSTRSSRAGPSASRASTRSSGARSKTAATSSTRVSASSRTFRRARSRPARSSTRATTAPSRSSRTRRTRPARARSRPPASSTATARRSTRAATTAASS